MTAFLTWVPFGRRLAGYIREFAGSQGKPFSACLPLTWKEVNRDMKKTLSKKALVKEAAFWNEIKKVVRENPGKVCHK